MIYSLALRPAVNLLLLYLLILETVMARINNPDFCDNVQVTMPIYFLSSEINLIVKN